MEEHDLLAALQQGDPSAFRVLYQRYHSRLYGYSIRVIKSPSLAEEVVHDVFIRVWERRATLRLDSSFKSYLFTINRNLLINLLQRASREKAIKAEIARHMPTAHCDPEAQLTYQDYWQQAQLAIAALPPQRRRVFEMCRLQGKSYEETARLLSISPGTVKDHIIKAKKAIGRYLRVHTNITITLLIAVLSAFLR